MRQERIPIDVSQEGFPLDLSFARANAHPVTTLPVELAVLMVGLAGRQGASATAQVQAAITRADIRSNPLAPEDGAFCGTTAALLRRWKDR